MSLQMREQRIVSALSAPGVLPSTMTRSRVTALPGMLLRHGLLQVVVFLRGKDRCELQIVDWLTAGIKAALLPERPTAEQERSLEAELTPEGLAKLGLGRYLLLQELAVEVATWLMRLEQARLADSPADGALAKGETP